VSSTHWEPSRSSISTESQTARRIRLRFSESAPPSSNSERADDHPELAIRDEHAKGHFPAVARTLEQRVERKLEVLEILEGQVEPRGEPAQHEMGDAVEGVVRGQRQADLVSDHVSLQSDPLGRTNNRRHRFRG
jgi:hypothetical protein